VSHYGRKLVCKSSRCVPKNVQYVWGMIPRCRSSSSQHQPFYLMLLTSSRKSPPSTHFSSPPPPAPSPPPVPPPLTPQPSPTSPITLAGRPPTTDPDAMTIFAGITVFGKILTFSLMMANWLTVTFSPMCTCDDIEMAWIVQPGPSNVSMSTSMSGERNSRVSRTNENIIPNLHGIVVHLSSADSARWFYDASS
jgi:hypothetical protein